MKWVMYLPPALVKFDTDCEHEMFYYPLLLPTPPQKKKKQKWKNKNNKKTLVWCSAQGCRMHMNTYFFDKNMGKTVFSLSGFCLPKGESKIVMYFLLLSSSWWWFCNRSYCCFGVDDWMYPMKMKAVLLFEKQQLLFQTWNGRNTLYWSIPSVNAMVCGSVCISPTSDKCMEFLLLVYMVSCIELGTQAVIIIHRWWICMLFTVIYAHFLRMLCLYSIILCTEWQSYLYSFFFYFQTAWCEWRLWTSSFMLHAEHKK